MAAFAGPTLGPGPVIAGPGGPKEEKLGPEVAVECVEQLERCIMQPEFLSVLEAAIHHQRHPLEAADALPHSDEESVFSDTTWEHAVAEEPQASSSSSASSSSTGQPGQQPEFILVERDDAVEAMAFYIAQCLVKHPEAQNMSPKQLQEALGTAFKALKQTKFKRLCSVGRSVYRWTTLTYSCVQMWQNPWIIRLVVTAIWTFSRMSIRALLP